MGDLLSGSEFEWSRVSRLGVCTGLAFLMISPLALASGVGSSGGGSAIVCRNANGTIQRAELLDLYEATERYGYELATSVGTMDDDYLQAAKRARFLRGDRREEDDQEVLQTLNDFFAMVRYTVPGEHLAPLGDIGQTVPPPTGCGVEQLAIFHDDVQKVDIDTEIWNALAPLNQAALVSHELYYRYERTVDEKTSELTRAIVAAAYSSSGPVPVLEGVPTGSRFCETRGENDAPGRTPPKNHLSGFYVYPTSAPGSGETGTTLQFVSVMGRPVLTKATAALDSVDWLLAESPAGLMPINPMANTSLVVPIDGARPEDFWKIGIEYIHGKPVKLSLYERGVLTEEAIVDHCVTDSLN